MMKRKDFIFLRKGGALHARWFTMLLAGLLLVAGNGFGQQKDGLGQKITYKASKAALSAVLKDVRKKTNVRFSYNSELVGRQQPVTVDVTAVPLRDFLQQVLGSCGLQFVEEMGVVIIYEKKEARTTAAEPQVPKQLSVLLRGQVTDPKGTPLPGVSIRGLASREMTTTSDEGMFVLFAQDKETVNFSLMGMKSFTYRVANATDRFLTFKMDTVVREIQEVVITGYQKIDPKLATGSYTRLKGSEVLQPGVANVGQMLQGKVPGLMVINNSGSVNAKPKMRIRGTSTLVGNASPLIVVDGMVRPDPVNIEASVLNNLLSADANANYELMGNAISGINVFDIESLTFLRDAAATAIYGTRAANGVIVITTKRGKVGPMQVNFNTIFSFQARPSYNNMRMMNSKERVELSRQLEADGTVFAPAYTGFRETYSYEGLRYALFNRSISQAEFNRRVAELETNNTDWFDVLYRNAIGSQNSLSFSGGAGKTTYYASVNYNRNNGAARLDGNTSYGAQMSVHTELGKRLSLDLTLNSAVSNATGYYGTTTNPQTYALQTSRSLRPDLFYPMSSYNNLAKADPNFLSNRGQPLYFNMLNELEHSVNTTSTRSTNLNLTVDYALGKRWKFLHMSSVSIAEASGFSAFDEHTYMAAKIRSWNLGETPPKTLFDHSSLPAGGIANVNQQSSTVWGMRNSLDYSVPLFNGRDQLNFTIGSELNSEKSDGHSVKEPGYFPDRGKTFFAGEMSRKAHARFSLSDGLKNTISGYGTLTYSLMNKYILRGDIRTDGSNRFGQYSNAKFLPNYSVSGRWNTYAEEWFPAGNLLSSFSLTASYGTQGNVVSAVGPNLVAYYETGNGYNPATLVPYMRIKSLPYPDLRWEKTRQLNIGVDMAFWNNRLRGGFNYYYKHSVDVIDKVDIDYEYGMEYMYRNGSELFNKGMELALSIDLIRKQDTRLTLSMNTSRNFNRKDRGNARTDINSFLNGTGHLPGKPISGFYSYIFDGLNPVNGVPMFKNLTVTEPAVKYSDPGQYLVYSGQMEPTLTLSVSPTLQYKSLSISTQFYAAMGNTRRLNPPFGRNFGQNGVPGSFINVPRDYMNRWRQPGDEAQTDIPSLIDNRTGFYYFVPYKGQQIAGLGYAAYRIEPLNAYELSDLLTGNGSYLRCKTVSAGYRIPQVMVRKMGVKNLSVSFTVNNVFVIASREMKGQDPETEGAGTTALPLTRQYAFGLNAGF
ncbi:SusC/RagA family TonB-linked outer membrane protein [Chitinophaga pollutisoli]|uniref:SusC/RagA family TonB-linked outer membrane protein n=1 Tax=Chitinophaga pollutisoli TaxID=3133966 RepID=A0ABZ2YV60_9BACT